MHPPCGNADLSADCSFYCYHLIVILVGDLREQSTHGAGNGVLQVGGAAVCTSIAAYMAHPELADPVHLGATWFGTFIGAVTLTGAPRPSPACMHSFSAVA